MKLSFRFHEGTLTDYRTIKELLGSQMQLDVPSRKESSVIILVDVFREDNFEQEDDRVLKVVDSIKKFFPDLKIIAFIFLTETKVYLESRSDWTN